MAMRRWWENSYYGNDDEDPVEARRRQMAMASGVPDDSNKAYNENPPIADSGAGFYGAVPRPKGIVGSFDMQAPDAPDTSVMENGLNALAAGAGAAIFVEDAGTHEPPFMPFLEVDALLPDLPALRALLAGATR